MKLYFDGEWRVRSKSQDLLFRDFMKQRREKLGLTVSAVQLASGLQHPTYANFENGTIKTPTSGLIAAAVLGVDFYLLGDIVEESHDEQRNTASHAVSSRN